MRCGVFLLFSLIGLLSVQGDAEKPEEFFTLIRDNNQVDMVLMIDRTFAMGRDNFYLVAMRLGYDIIRHHLWVGDDRVRLALLTVGNTSNTTYTTIVNGISDDPNRTTFSKCDLFNNDESENGTKNYWSKLKYDGSKDCEFPETARLIAYQTADKILTTGKRLRPNATQIVMFITVPICINDYKNINEAEKTLRDEGVRIFPIELTQGDDTLDRESTEWMTLVQQTPPILNYTNVEEREERDWAECTGDKGYCYTTTGFILCNKTDPKTCDDSPCENGGTCYESSHHPFVCFCRWGYIGRNCEITENTCEVNTDACVNQDSCRFSKELITYTCANNDYNINPYNCTITRENCEDEKANIWRWVIVGVPVCICVLIVLGGTLYACYMICCSKKKVERRQKVVRRAREIRSSVGAAAHNARRSIAAIGKPPPLPPKETQTLRPTAVAARIPQSPPVVAAPQVYTPPAAPPVAFVPPTPTKPTTLPIHKPPLISPKPQLTDSAPQINAPTPPPMTPRVPLNRPSQFVRLTDMAGDRESMSEYLEPGDSDYEGEFDDFYDYAWKTGELQPPSQYLYLIDESNKPCLPQAPTSRHQLNRPIGTDGYGWAPLQKDMLSWQNYVCDLTGSHDENDLDRLCIMQIDGQRWIASDNSLRPTDEQLAELWNAFHVKSRNGAEIKLGSGKERTFAITENDGVILKGVGGKAGKRDEMLCITRTKQFIVLAGLELSRDNGQLECEVTHIRQHLLKAE